MRWGLIPFWSKDAKVAFSTINAKAETITTSPVFRDAFKRRRCLVLADLFYEWRRIDTKMKQPYAIAMMGALRLCWPLGHMERQGHRASDKYFHRYHYRSKRIDGTAA